MRIYLDNCVYQDLKKIENSEIYNTIMESKQSHLYLFSEAHLYDLSRDASDEKYIDMELIELICENNCLLNDGNGARLLTPKEYYDMYDWDSIGENDNILDSDDPLANLIMNEFEKVLLPFNSIFKEEYLSEKYPQEFKNMFTQPSNLREFAELMLNSAIQMENHSNFKGILQGGREIELTEDVYKALHINGFNGEIITDKEKFKESYVRFINKGYELNRNSQVDDYQNFMNMYMGLEILNIVKGKPRKQKFTNLMNDSRHAYFGASCDIIVSKDIDFIAKTKFMYDVFDIKTLVLSFDEFKNRSNLTDKNNLNELINEIVSISKYIASEKSEITDSKVLFIPLRETHLGYFNMFYKVEYENKMTFLVTKEIDEYKNKTLINEIKLITNRIVDSLGLDNNGKGYFERNEIINGSWSGRTWEYEQISIYLNYREIIELTFYEKTSNCQFKTKEEQD